MPIITEHPLVETAEDRMRLFLTENRLQPAEPQEQEAPSFAATLGAAGSTQNIVGSFITNRISRIMAGINPIHGDPTSSQREWDPGRYLQDEDFYRTNPHAITGYEQLAGARDEKEFWHTLDLLRQTQEDFETLGAAGWGGTAASLAANLVDPTNLIPYGVILKTARGVGAARLMMNIARGAAIGAAGNVVQEELLRKIQPGVPIERLEADLVAAGFGAVFGGSLSFLAAPNFRGRKFPSLGADDAPTHVPTAKMVKIRERVMAMFSQDMPDLPGQKPRNVVSALEDGEINIRQMLKSEPDDTDSISVLFRRDNPEAGIEADANGKLIAQLEAKYDQAGVKLDIVRHPLQDDYDAFAPLERSLNDAALTLRRLESESTGAQPAVAVDTTANRTDRAVQEGVTVIAKALQFGTPGRTFEKSLLDTTGLLRRVFFYDGSVSRAALQENDLKGPVSAEALKDLYSRHLYETMREIRAAYDPSREISATLGRDANDNVSFTGFQKLAAKFRRAPITYTNAAGEPITIPAYAHYGQFAQEAVNVIRERKAVADGFVAENLQQVPPQLERAVKAIENFNQTFLDLADQVELLPGPRSLEKARIDLDAASRELREAEAEWRKTEGILTPEEIEAAITDIDGRLDNVPPDEAQALRQRRAELVKQQGEDPSVKTIYTSVPEVLRGRVLFEWSGSALRLEGAKNGPIPIPGDRPRSFWINEWNRDLSRVRVPNAAIVRALREVTSEIWPVLSRKGKYWNTSYYLAPTRAIEEAKKIVAQKARGAAEAKMQMAARRHAAVEARVHHIEQFMANAQNYFTRRFIHSAVRNNKDGFKSWLKRSWNRSRNLGTDPETGNAIRLADNERPLIDEVRENLKIGEEYRNEGDLLAGDTANGTDLHSAYLREAEAFYERSAESTWLTITDPNNAHGVDQAFTTPSPLQSRRLVVNEADPAAREFLDFDPERTLAAYNATVGGRIATHNAVQRAEPLLRKAGLETRVEDALFGDERLATPAEIIKQLDTRFGELNTVLSAVDRQANTKLAVQVQADRERVMKRMNRRVANLEGQALGDPTEGANALWSWGGRQLLSMNYLALLGSQTLSAMNDAAAVTLFAEISSIPQNVKYLTRAMLPLKNAARRDLELMRMAFEGEHSRVMAMADIDFDNPMEGIGFGRTRQTTAAIGAGIQNMNAAFNELSLINTWNRYIKRAAAMISMDRLVTHSRRMIEANRLMATGVTQAEALRKAGISNWDYARLKDSGINAQTAKRMLDLIHKHGTDEDGATLATLSDEQFANYKGLALPNAGEWLKAEGDAARPLYDTYLTAINTQVERAMVIMPGLTDKPLINDHWWGRAINQFQTFNMAWANQIARPLAQRPAGRQMAAVAAYFGTGAFVDAIRNHLSGRRDIDETAALWLQNPLGMTYAVVNTSGLSGWFNRPAAFFDKVGLGPGAMLGNQQISRAAFQSRTFWGSLSPTADLIDRTMYGGLGWAGQSEMNLSHWHALRKSVPMQNLIWFRASSRFMGIDPMITEQLMRHRYEGEEPRP